LQLPSVLLITVMDVLLALDTYEMSLV